MARLVVEKVICEDPWYAVTCERCNTYLGLLAKRMWGRDEVDHYPCYVCEPRAVGALTRDRDPSDAFDFAFGEDMALYAVDSTYQSEFHERLQARLSVLDRKGGR